MVLLLLLCYNGIGVITVQYTGRVVTKGKDELIHILDHFNIQVRVCMMSADLKLLSIASILKAT